VEDFMMTMQTPNDPMLEGRSGLGLKLVLVATVIVAFTLAILLAFNNGKKSGSDSSAPPGAPTPIEEPRKAAKTKIGVAYGTEKRTWLEWAAQEFAAVPDGQRIDVELIPAGSLQAAQRIWKKDQSIHVWSPASALYKDVFVREWQSQYGANPILKEESLALTPMVFVMWEQRYQAFAKTYPELSFRTVASAMNEKGGWDAIAQRPDWMFFKFGHTHPNESNSGLMTLVLMAYDFHNKAKGLSGRDLTGTEFQTFLQQVESGVVAPMGTLVSSTGSLMDDMVRKGPSTYDAVFVYESVAIDQLKKAEGRWDTLRVVYPKYNLWNDNPYYVLNVPWSTPEHRKAADAFLKFLLSEPIQARALEHGFRPANTNVSTRGPDSPFVKYGGNGLREDLPGAMCAPVDADVINGLLTRWQQIRGGR
jgi:Ca-activated chloride channel family protein